MGTLNTRCRIILGTQKGTLILTTTQQILNFPKLGNLTIRNSGERVNWISNGLTRKQTLPQTPRISCFEVYHAIMTGVVEGRSYWKQIAHSMKHQLGVLCLNPLEFKWGPNFRPVNPTLNPPPVCEPRSPTNHGTTTS